MQTETIQASPQQATIDSGTAASATITFSDSGIVDVSRLQILVQDDDASQATGTGVVMIDITEIARVTAITFNGTTLFVAGRNTASPPAGIFSRRRLRNFVRLPKIRVKPADTLVVTVIYIQTSTDGRMSVSVPLAPDRFANTPQLVMDPNKPEVVVGSPEIVIADVDGTGNALTCTFDKSGLVDLSRMVIKCSALLTCTIAADSYGPVDLNHVPIFLLQLIHNTDYNIVGGQGTPSAPNSFEWGRAHNWFNLGIIRVAPGDTLVATVSLFDTGVLLDNASASMMVPQQPDGSIISDDLLCRPCG